MKRSRCIGSLLLLVLGCSDSLVLPPTDAGTPGGQLSSPTPAIAIRSSAQLFPVAALHLAGAGLPVPGLEGLDWQLEEPLGSALADPQATLAQGALVDGGFWARSVPVSPLVVGLVARLEEPDGGQARFVRTATPLIDLALSGRPEHDLVASTSYALPSAFHDALTRAVGEAYVHRLTGADGGTPRQSLLEAGCVLGQLLDSLGAPVEGATLELGAGQPSQWLYPSADFTTTQPATSTNGLFLYLHHGAPQPASFHYQVTGRPEYLTRSAVAAQGRCWLVLVLPGKTAP
jgi:hypothetical protein